jgi:O-antigen/teichoic acid export membrane protein
MRFIGILSGHGATAILTLARNLVAASLLPLQEYGLAATFLIVASLVEMFTQFGQSVLIVADRDGDGEAALARYHGFNLVRGLIGAGGLALGALALAPADQRAMYLALALVPAFGAVQHFAQFQRQREGKTGLAVLVPMIAAFTSLAALVAFAQIMPDARAFLIALIVQAGTAFFLSHMFAGTPYRVAFRASDLARQFSAGLPLLINGGLLYLILFGERIIVGQILGLEALGVFAMGVTLTLTPSILMSKSLMTSWLPRLSRDGLGGQVLKVLSAHVLIALGLAVALALAGPVFVTLALPVAFAPLAALLPLMAAQQSLRLMKGAQAVVGIAVRHASDEIAVSLVRIAALPLAYVAALNGHGIYGIVLAGLAGEVAAVLVAMGLIIRRSSYGAASMTPLLSSGESS